MKWRDDRTGLARPRFVNEQCLYLGRFAASIKSGSRGRLNAFAHTTGYFKSLIADIRSR